MEPILRYGRTGMFDRLKSIKTRFLLIIVLTVLAFLGIMLVMSYSTLKEAALRNAEELSRTVIDQADMRIDSFFKEIRRLAVSMAGFPSFYEVRPEDMRPVVLSAVEARKDYLRSIYLGTKDGRMFEWGLGEGFDNCEAILDPDYDPRQRPWYRQALDAGEFHISEPYEYASVRALGITGAVPVYDEEGLFVGVLGIDIMLEDLKKIVDSLKLGMNEGIILLNRDNEMIINQFNGSGHSSYPALEKFDLFDVAKLDDCQRGHVISPEGHGNKYYVQCTRNSMTGWKLLIALPYASVMSHTVHSIELIAFIDILLMLLLLVFLSYQSSSVIINPLQETISVLDRLESGESDARLDSGRPDEFGILARKFNRLIDLVRANSRDLENKVRERTEKLVALQKENIRLRIIEEKERIYGYLHDSLGARLTNIFISNNVARSAASRDQKTLEDMFDRIGKNTEQAISDLKEILHSSEDDKRRIIDFTRLIKVNIMNSLDLKGIKLFPEIDTSDELNSLSREVRFEIEKILQELVNNVLKHSGANRVDLKLEVQDGYVVLEFRDNGCGGAGESVGSDSFGLRNIRKRIQSLGGTFYLHSPRGEGTCLKISIPAARR